MHVHTMGEVYHKVGVAEKNIDPKRGCGDPCVIQSGSFETPHSLPDVFDLFTRGGPPPFVPDAQRNHDIVVMGRWAASEHLLARCHLPCRIANGRQKVVCTHNVRN